MNQDHFNRRGFIHSSVCLATPLMLASRLPLLAGAKEAAAGRTQKVMCIGAHPDDPESGCAGTLTRYAAMGHRVTIIYLTRGERGIAGTGLDEAAKIRSKECEAACAMIGA